MKATRTLVFAIIMLALATTAMAETKGWGLGAGVFDGDFFAQARKDFRLGGDISRLNGQAGVYFQGRTTFRLDANYHFILNPDNPGRFYPLVGVDFAFNSDSVKLGANAGGGVNFMFTDKLAGFGEFKYVFGSWDGWAFMGGIYF